jgi:hypothetical protein
VLTVAARVIYTLVAGREYIDPGKYTNPGKKYPKPKNKSK